MQYQKALKESEDVFKQDDKNERQERLKEINEAFDEGVNYPDYARKLYLIENCIYGVDIQPIAIQISKLRFFTSLVLDQKVDRNKENLGIRALPNLETKFVSANTLISLGKPAQLLLKNPDIEKKEEELKQIRHKYFEAKTRKEKLDYQKNDQQIRKEIADLLKDDGWDKSIAQKITKYDLYDPNASADWFDPEWMFGITDGFDVVIGNPPYVQIKQISWNGRKIYEQKFKSAVGRFNLFYFFLELAGNLTKKSGISAFIVPDRLLLNTQCDELRKWLLNKQTITEIDSFAEGVFEAVVDSIIIIYKNIQSCGKDIKVKNQTTSNTLNQDIAIKIPVSYFLNSPSNQFDLSYNPFTAKLIEKIKLQSIGLGKISDTKDGIIQSKISDILFLKKPIDEESKKLLFGKDVNRYHSYFNSNWVNYKPEEMMKIELQRNGGGLRLRNKSIFERNKILTRQTADEIIAAYDAQNYYYSNTLHGTTITEPGYSPLYVLALLNSRLMTWYYRSTTAEAGKVFAQVKIEILRQLPIKYLQDQKIFIEIIDKILAITKASDYLENPAKKKEVKEYEKQIDQMVYKLYGLTDEEIKIVEDKS